MAFKKHYASRPANGHGRATGSLIAKGVAEVQVSILAFASRSCRTGGL
ncbi:hypothetical protein AtDm6_2325 [Acetobacter tropicalis]|uniref:Uncharacterized protein n=1 Tax=Acetobacter tropicalis TaxID=104102 RepID=A0A094YNY3_9PROT|nr:hypothetical protein AtDm6_2325 [Acetobacter tropicalis]